MENSVNREGVEDLALNFRQKVFKSITLSITTTGNMEALQMALCSVLNGELLPGIISLRFEGELPSFGNFYLEQLAEIARLKTVRFVIKRARSKGIHHARQTQILDCNTPLLWILDDDVIPFPDCLSSLVYGSSCLKGKWGWINAVKVDVNNRRGYADYSADEIPFVTWVQKHNGSCNHFVRRSDIRCNSLCSTERMDFGNVLLNAALLKTSELNFNQLGDFASGGEDELFAMFFSRIGLSGFVSLWARSYHLEKEKPRFTEMASRREMLRLAKLLLNHGNSSCSKLD